MTDRTTRSFIFPKNPPGSGAAPRGFDMKLTVWTYEGPPHVGAMRVATAMTDLHYVLHAPQGDTLCRPALHHDRAARPTPAGHLHHLRGPRPRRGHRRHLQEEPARTPMTGSKPQALIVGASCTAELIQDDPGGLAETNGHSRPGRGAGASVLPAEGKLRHRRDVLSACPRTGATDGQERPRSPRTSSVRSRWASATATTSRR